MVEDGLKAQELHLDFPRGCGLHHSSSEYLTTGMGGEVLNLQSILDLNLLETHIDSLDGIDAALVGEEARLLSVGYFQRIVAVLDVLLESFIDFDDASLAGLLLVKHKRVIVQEH